MTRCTRHTINNSRHERFRIHAADLEYGVTLASYSASRSLQTPSARSNGEMRPGDKSLLPLDWHLPRRRGLFCLAAGLLRDVGQLADGFASLFAHLGRFAG